MTAHPNLNVLERGLVAFAARDMAALRDIFHESLRWHYASTSALAGTYEGLDEVFELFARRAALSGETYRLHLEEAVANDQFVTLLGRTRAERGAVRYEDTICYVFRMNEGKVVEAWGMPAHPERERQFYG